MGNSYERDDLYTKYRVFREPSDSPGHPAVILAPPMYRDISGTLKDLVEVKDFVFVLKPGTDEHARVAMAAYAWSVMGEKPLLAKDLLDVLSGYGPTPES